MDKWVSVGKYGLRYREHSEKVTGVGRRKRPLRYYAAVYKWQGKVVTDAYGWEGEGFHNEDDVVETALMLRKNRKAMTPPFTLRELIEERAQALEAKAKQERQQADRWTIEKLWTEYRKHLSGGEATKPDISRWNLYLQKWFGGKEPKDLVRLDVDRLRINLLNMRSPQTSKHVVALLRRIINFGVDRGLVPPLGFKIGLPAVDNIKTEDLSPEQLMALFSVLESSQRTTCAAMMKLVLFTGMRRGELFKLQWRDLDFERGFINIMEPKGGKSQKIPMNQNAREIFASITRTSEYVFPARNGGPRKDISKDLRAIKRAAGLPDDFRALHGLRHVYATMLASSGLVDMLTLQKLLTHKSPEMTQRYIHFRDEALRRASDVVDEVLSKSMRTNKKIVNIK